MTELLRLPEIEALARDCMLRTQVPAAVAQTVARDVTLAEAAGLRIGGLKGLLRDIRLIRYGRLLPGAAAVRSLRKPAQLAVDAGHGFAAFAVDDAIVPLRRAAEESGVAVLWITRCSAPDVLAGALTATARAGFWAELKTDRGHPAMALPGANGVQIRTVQTPRDTDEDSPLDGPVDHGARITVYASADPPAHWAQAARAELVGYPDAVETVAVSANLIADLAGA